MRLIIATDSTVDDSNEPAYLVLKIDSFNLLSSDIQEKLTDLASDMSFTSNPKFTEDVTRAIRRHVFGVNTEKFRKILERIDTINPVKDTVIYQTYKKLVMDAMNHEEALDCAIVSYVDKNLEITGITQDEWLRPYQQSYEKAMQDFKEFCEEYNESINEIDEIINREKVYEKLIILSNMHESFLKSYQDSIKEFDESARELEATFIEWLDSGCPERNTQKYENMVEQYKRVKKTVDQCRKDYTKNCVSYKEYLRYFYIFMGDYPNIPITRPPRLEEIIPDIFNNEKFCEIIIEIDNNIKLLEDSVPICDDPTCESCLDDHEVLLNPLRGLGMNREYADGDDDEDDDDDEERSDSPGEEDGEDDSGDTISSDFEEFPDEYLVYNNNTGIVGYHSTVFFPEEEVLDNNDIEQIENLYS